MHRRSFVTLLVAALTATPLVTRANDAVSWARRNLEPVEPTSSVSGIHPLVQTFPDDAAAFAEIEALGTLGHSEPKTGTPETFPPVTILPAPAGFDLPAVMRRYDGPAVFPHQQSETLPYISLDVQRGAWVVSIMVRGEDEEELIALATDLMRTMVEYPLPTSTPTQDTTGRRSGGIWDLLLKEADVPDGFRLYQESDPSSTVNFEH